MPATNDASAELPPPPELMTPNTTTNASAPKSDPNAVPADAPPPDENFPPLPESTDADAAPPELSPEMESANVPATGPSLGASTEFSSAKELKDMGMEARLNAKELVLWLYFGGSYGSVSPKGVTTTTTSSTGTPGGLGYNAGIGWMLSGNLQMAVDFVGTPQTTTATVDSAMVGIGPKLGFISVMALFGVQSAHSFTDPSQGKLALMAYGVMGGLDIIFSHSKDSRVSYGFAPQVYYITPQASIGGYTQLGASVSLRIYGYENAF